MDMRTDLQKQSDALFAKMVSALERVVLDKPVGAVPAGSVFWTGGLR
jgi:hypothetical protein